MNPHGASVDFENLSLVQRVISFCAHNRALTLLAVAVACVLAVYTLKEIRLDALPDLSDTQVIVYSHWDRSPDIIEDQVTYPIVTALLGAPHVKAIRGFSDFGFSYVYVIFQDGTDIYWARSRVLEYLSKIIPRLPAGVQTELGPDATGVGWVFQYALVDTSGSHSLDELRSYQDWTLRYALQAVPGVAEVASIGGFQKQYQVTVDPNRLAAYGLSLDMVTQAMRDSNNEVGGRLLEFAGTEYMVRGRGYAQSLGDFEQIVVKVAPGGVPVLLKDVARVELGPEIRRGVSDLDGLGDHVGGIVVMRHGENALNVIERVKEKLRDLDPSLPRGVEIVTTYDRSDLIERAIAHPEARADHRDDHRLAGDPALPLAHPLGDRADHHHSGLGAARLHPALLHGGDGQHHVARRHRHLHRRAGGRRDRGGGERLQQDPPLGRRGAEGGLPQGAPGGPEGGRAVGLLLALGDRRGVPPGLRPGGPGGAALQAPGLLEEPGHGHRRAARHHPGPGACGCCSPGSTPSSSSPGSWPGSRATPWSGPTTPRSGTPSAGRSSGSTSRRAGSCCATPRA